MRGAKAAAILLFEENSQLKARIEALEAALLKRQEREIMILVHLYQYAPVKVADLCDTVLDRSGGLLGRVRDQARARAALNKDASQ